MAQHRELPIVGFTQIAQAFGGRVEAHAAIGSGPLPEITECGTADERARFRAVIGRAFIAMQDAETSGEVLSSPDDQAGALLQAFLAETATDEKRTTPGRIGVEAKFDEHDWWGWIRHAGWPYLKSKLGIANRHPRLPWPSDSTRLPNHARLAILGDWGSGAYGAPECSAHIATDPRGFDAVVHLGDVYYAGTQREVDEQFIAQWPWIDGVVNRACNSNHEMYSAGKPYFDTTLRCFGQSSSAFVLETDHWLLVGLDTAYDDFDLAEDQVTWLEALVGRMEDRRLVLFSHHQLYSHFGRQGVKLQEKLRSLLEARRVAAWYWGHEHLLALYDPHPAWGLHGRCIGHGGFPYSRPRLDDTPHTPLPARQTWCHHQGGGATPPARILDGPNPYLGSRADEYGPHGIS